MKKCIACIGALMILSSSAFGQWYNRTDWELISDTAHTLGDGRFNSLYGAWDNDYVYLQLNLNQVDEETINPWDDGGFRWLFDINDGTGWNPHGNGNTEFFADASIVSAHSAYESGDEGWNVGDNLTLGAGQDDYTTIFPGVPDETYFYEPFNAATGQVIFRADRRAYHEGLGMDLFPDNTTIGIGVLGGDGASEPFMFGNFLVPEPGTMSLLAIGLLGVIGLRRRLNK